MPGYLEFHVAAFRHREKQSADSLEMRWLQGQGCFADAM